MPDVVGKIMGSNTGGGRKPFTYTPGGLDLSHIRQSARVKRYEEQPKPQQNQTLNYNQPPPTMAYNQPPPFANQPPFASQPPFISQPPPFVSQSPNLNYNQPQPPVSQPPWSPPAQQKSYNSTNVSNTLPKSKPKPRDTGFHVSVEELKRAKSKDDGEVNKGPYVLFCIYFPNPQNLNIFC